MAGQAHKNCQGVKKNVVEKKITHDDYIKYLETKAVQIRKWLPFDQTSMLSTQKRLMMLHFLQMMING